ncbi:MAG: hypothetical protein ABIP51_06895 [Bacteroidia bacterium]
MIATVCILVSAITFYSCRQDKGKLVVNCKTPTTVSFANDIQPIFQKNCATAGCHSAPNPAANLNLDAAVAYAQITFPGKGYVDTINPTASLLHSQMISTSDPMPPTGLLSVCTSSLILKWIEQKAKKN